MPQIQSYTQAVRQQVEPPIKQLLSTVFDDFSEQLKLPDSPAKRLLNTMVAMVSSMQLSERLATEAQALLHYLKEVNATGEITSKLKDKSKLFRPGGHSEKEEKEEEIDSTGMLHDTSLELEKIQQQKQVLQASYLANMEGFEDA